MAAILNDNTQGVVFSDIPPLINNYFTSCSGHDPIYSLVYEHTHVMKDSLELHLWGYRPRITLEHLTRYMQQQKKKFPILEGFLKNVKTISFGQEFTNILCCRKLY